MHGDILVSNTTAGTYAPQARSPQQRHHFRGEPARGGTRRESFHAIGGVARFFQQLALRGGRLGDPYSAALSVRSRSISRTSEASDSPHSENSPSAALLSIRLNMPAARLAPTLAHAPLE